MIGSELDWNAHRISRGVLELGERQRARNPIAEASVDHVVKVTYTEEHENRAADWGCVSRLVRLLHSVWLLLSESEWAAASMRLVSSSKLFK